MAIYKSCSTNIKNNAQKTMIIEEIVALREPVAIKSMVF
jgi:hypothetical protein